MDIEVIGQKSVEWIYVADGGEHWRAVVSTVMNTKVYYNVGNLLTG
jgi:hypothetical protein